LSIDIFLVRHGETVWNRERRVQGRLDSPLTERGIEQARAYGRTLAHVLDAVERCDGPKFLDLVASPLGRTRATAAIVAAALGRPEDAVRYDPLLSEMTWGAWDGLTAAEIEARDPELWRARIADRFTVAPPGGGETQQDIHDRAARWLHAQPPAARLVVVGHGAFGRALRCVFTGRPAAAMLELDEPQDAFFRLIDGRIERIDCLY